MRGKMPILFSLLVSFLIVGCYVGSVGDEAPNQGALQQTAQGQIVANLTNKGIVKDARLNEQSMIALYIYRKKDYSLSCTTATNPKKCEDLLIFKNEKLDALGFTNEPGYFGYDADFDSYSPMLVAEGNSYPYATKPADPPGFPDPDVWQCRKITYPSSPDYGKYECGVNSHPIRNFKKDLTTYTLQGYATNGRGYASSYILDYNLFNSLNHPVKDGDRFYAYFAVHFKAIKAARDSEDRFDKTTSTWKRPIEPDLISPRIEINMKMLAEGAYDKPGSVYDIPDYATWYDPFAGCRPTTGVAGSVYFSEILWMGSKSIAAVSATEDEFIELYNNTGAAINISGWKIKGAATGGGDLVLPLCATIPANGVYTVGKQTTKAFTQFDYTASGISLSNSGVNLVLEDAQGTTIHTMTSCTSPAWGGRGVNGGANTPKRSMRLAAIATASPLCTAWVTTSTGDTNYPTASANVSALYAAPDDVSEGTVATPGY
ncbi:MAG TPA: lamin tail domain-containing protein, partial [Turneriella sp.]|nr:lamin tail domain-containing protein [Turneriella sp.]